MAVRYFISLSRCLVAGFWCVVHHLLCLEEILWTLACLPAGRQVRLVILFDYSGK